MTDTQAKEIATTSTTVTRRAEPSLVALGDGKRLISSDGKFHQNLAGQDLLDNRSRWINVGELARVFCGANTTRNKQRIRRSIPQLFVWLLELGHVMTVESDPKTRRVDALKIYDPRAEVDRQTIRVRLDGMARRNQITSARHDQAERLLVEYDAASAPDVAW